MVRDEQQGGTIQRRFVLNWLEELKRLAGAEVRIEPVEYGETPRLAQASEAVQKRVSVH